MVLISILFFLVFFGFALIGVVVALRWLFLSPIDVPPPTSRPLRDMNEDVVGACHLLNHLYSEKQITTDSYNRFRAIVEQVPGSAANLPDRLPQHPDGTVTEETQTEIEVASDVVGLEIARQKVPHADFAPPLLPVAQAVAPVVTDPAPWDMPDAPPTPPRRSFNDVLSAFMMEKNIRWGELASGILIIGSAVGLVVSLRNELTRTIPYFPALLFLLITAAIHAAGSYTLKKWKLRKTSRGTLLIGLLLVPLNFLAASILSGSEQLRRPVSDPLYWTAIIIGVAAFGLMTWWSSRLLLKRGHWPMVLGVMGAAATTLIINRLDLPANSSWTVLWTTLPLAVALFLGTGILSPTIRSNRTWTDRTLNRTYMLLGLAVFACITAGALVIVRADDNTYSVTAIMPLAVFMSMVAGWTGLIAYDGVVRTKSASQKVVTRSLSILGAILAVLALIVSALNPTILMIGGLVVAVVGWAIVYDRKLPALMPVVWSGLAIALICGINLALNKSGIDARTGLAGLGDLFFSGQSGLGLMGLGLAIGAVFGIARPAAEVFPAKSARRANLFSGAVVGSLGSLFALVAGLLHRESQFDTMTASGLLGVATFVTLGLATSKDRPAFPHLAVIVSFAFFAFTFLWNPTTSQWLASILGNVQANWLTTFAVHGLVLSAAACVASVRLPQASNGVSALGSWSAVSSALAVVAGLLHAPEHSGIATVMMAVVTVAWLGVAWSTRNARSESEWSTSLMIVASLFLVVMLIENSVRLGIVDWKQPQHWLIQATVLAIFAFVWTAGRLVLGREAFRWLFDHDSVRGEHFVQFAVVAVLLGMLGFALYEANARQLVAGFESQWFAAQDHVGLCMVAVVALFASLALSFALKRTQVAGVALVIVWCLGWSVPSLLFDGSNSSGSAMRWLLSSSCVVTAGLVASRRLWQKPGVEESEVLRPDSGRSMPNVIIDWFLAISVGIVILVSSVTVARVMLSESQVGALGGPVAGSWFARISMEVSYGVPVALVTAAFLMFAIFERRQWLATIGSAVYQYMVLLSIVLLFLSPHPRLATSWFLGILQAVSIGMSVYGMAWFVFRKRVRGVALETASNGKSPSQIEIHSLINALLVTSLAVLVGWRFFAMPASSGGWIDAAGGPLGLFALVLVSLLLCLVERDRVREGTVGELATWMIGWFGMVLVAMLAANLDWYFGAAWTGLRTIVWGSVATLAAVGVQVVLFRRRAGTGAVHSYLSGPVWITSLVALVFAVRGGLFDQASVWQYGLAIASVVVIVTTVGILVWIRSAQYIGMAGIVAGSIMMRLVNPAGIFPNDQPGLVNLVVTLLCVLGGIWSLGHVLRRDRAVSSHGFSALPNVVLLGSSIWILVGGLLQWAFDVNSFWANDVSTLANGMGLAAIVATIALAAISLWHERIFVRVPAVYLITVGLAIVVASVVTKAWELEPVGRNLWAMFALAMTVLFWGVIWAKRGTWQVAFVQWSVARPAAIESGLSTQLPLFGLILCMAVLANSMFTIAFVDLRPWRYLAALTPFLLAIGVGCTSNQQERRHFQIVSLLITTFALVLLGWADLPTLENDDDGIQWLVRVVLVLAGTMFVYGALVSRWTRAGDSWLRSLREMTVVTCAFAVTGLVLLVLVEQGKFVAGTGCGIGVPEASALSVVVTGMIVGLVTIAMRPKLDPFAMSEIGRTIYVYVAQAVSVLLIIHLYLTMPWLFQSGIRQYWPYILMAIAFGGVGIAQVLAKRDLKVLSQPLFNAAATLPVLVSIGIWSIDSKADASMVLFTAGLAYLMISQTSGSMLAGLAAIILGNLALWVFYNRFPEFSFAAHPQLWLIPPAISVLVASQLSRDRFNAGQLATVRYTCMAVIYVSSTSEIFIGGIAENLWPPLVLAVLAIVGIFAGMALQVRAYLYLGSLFLLMAMITMVSHAHQRLGHVWPWWAFGIGAGLSILIMFGLFEKHRNKVKSVTSRLQEWDL